MWVETAFALLVTICPIGSEIEECPSYVQPGFMHRAECEAAGQTIIKVLRDQELGRKAEDRKSLYVDCKPYTPPREV